MSDYNITEKLRPCSVNYALGLLMHRTSNGRERESYHHLHAKQQFAKMLTETKGPLSIHSDDTTTSMVWEVDLSKLRPVVECAWPDGVAVPNVADYYAEHGRYPRRIFDIGMVDEAGAVVGAFEIVYTHSITDAKALDLDSAGVFRFTIPAGRTDRPPTHAITASNCFLAQPGANRVKLTICHNTIKEDQA